MNNILIGAEGLDGANFLASCLTMSEKVYFNNVNLNEKIKFFFNGMSHIPKKNGVPIWSDVSMLVSNCARAKEKLKLSVYHSRPKTLNDKHLISKICLPIFYPLLTHSIKNSEDPLTKLIDSKYFIGLINPNLFISLRSVLIDSKLVDNTIPNFNLFTVEEFNSLPTDIKEKIKYNHQSKIEQLFNYEIHSTHKWHMSNMECYVNEMDIILQENKNLHLYKESNELLKNKITHEWDCNWFLTEDETVEHIKILYSELDLGKCNEQLIRKMYKIWIHRINYVKKSCVKAFDVASINISTLDEL